MNELERQLKKDDGIQNQLKSLIQEVQRLREENHEMNQKIDEIQQKLDDSEIYDNTSKSNYLTNKPSPIVKEFKNKITKKSKKGVDVSTISTLFGIKPRQAYNVKDRIVQEESWIAEIPKSNGKNRVVSKKHYLTKLIVEEYPKVPAQVNESYEEDFQDLDWRSLFNIYQNNAGGKPEKDDKLERLEEWFDV